MPHSQKATAMNRPLRKFCSLVLSASLVAPGCAPQQPFYCREDGDLSHYLDVATEIEYPDVEEPSLNEVINPLRPLTLENADNYETWDLSLEEAVKITLCNSQVMRRLGGQAAEPGLSSSVEAISRTISSPVQVVTTYDPALVETVTGQSVGSPFQGSGPEAALSEFDARLDASVFWEKNRRPQNAVGIPQIRPDIFAQETGTFGTGITKTTADGSIFAFRNNTLYEGNNIPAQDIGNPQPSRLFASDWTTNFEATFSRPLLQGAGVQYNRIAGPMSFDQYSAGLGNPVDGVVVARIRTDQTIADFEAGVRDLVRDVETNYWNLYFAYRDLEARKMGRDSAQETWRKTAALYRVSTVGGSAADEARARLQYFQFRAQVEQALTEVYRAESLLRYNMGLSASDGRLIRPSDEPSSARVAFDWIGVHTEALSRRVELRRQKWEIKKRELELIAARNFLLPRLDAVGRYRWLGLGDELLSHGANSSQFRQRDSSAFGVLTSGEFQEWQLGLQLNVPIGFRRELSGIRHQELLIARERAIYQDLELEISHQMASAIRDVDLNYRLTQTNFNQRVAAEAEVVATNASYQANIATLDLLLDAQRRRAEAESAYYRSLIDYNKAIMLVHYRKGSLLEYDGVYLAEGQWPAKAYFDALRQARKRDASMYLDYGYTRPNVISRGPYEQWSGSAATGGPHEMLDATGPTPDEASPPATPSGSGEQLPSPDFDQPMSTPPEDTSSQLEPGTNEWQSSLIPRRDATHMSRTLVTQKVPVG
jgi:outer membrane protein TolC